VSDTADDYRALKAHHRERRDLQAEANIKQLAKLRIKMYMQSVNVWRMDPGPGKRPVLYYPSSNKWQHKGKITHGTPQQFKQWLTERGYI
jgi:hypothetical protein